jgi:hypothetical protein
MATESPTAEVCSDHVARSSDSSQSAVPTNLVSDISDQTADNATSSTNTVANISQPCNTFAELMPVPKRHRPVCKRPRAKPPSYELTSDSHLTFIANKEDKVSKKNAGNKSVKKTGSKKKSVGRKKGRNDKKVSSCASEEDVRCIYCNELFSESGGRWVQCGVCKNWAEYSCAGFDRKQRNFVCDFCA